MDFMTPTERIVEMIRCRRSDAAIAQSFRHCYGDPVLTLVVALRLTLQGAEEFPGFPSLEPYSDEEIAEMRRTGQSPRAV